MAGLSALCQWRKVCLPIASGENVSWIDSDTGKLVPKLLQVAPGGSWCASTYLESKILQGTLGAVMRNVFSLPTKWFLWSAVSAITPRSSGSQGTISWRREIFLGSVKGCLGKRELGFLCCKILRPYKWYRSFQNIHRRYLLGGIDDFEKNWGGSPDHSRFLWRLHCILPSKRTYAGQKTIQISYTRRSCTLPTISP